MGGGRVGGAWGWKRERARQEWRRRKRGERELKLEKFNTQGY